MSTSSITITGRAVPLVQEQMFQLECSTAMLDILRAGLHSACDDTDMSAWTELAEYGLQREAERLTHVRAELTRAMAVAGEAGV